MSFPNTPFSFSSITSDIDSVIVVGTSLLALKAGPVLKFPTKPTFCNVLKDKKILEGIERHTTDFVDSRGNHYFIGSSGAPNAIHVIVGRSPRTNAKLDFLTDVAEAISRLSEDSQSLQLGIPFDYENGQQDGIQNVYQSDWIEFVQLLEQVQQEQRRPKYLYFVYKHNLKINKDDGFEYLESMAGIQPEKILFHQIHVGVEFHGPPETATYFALNKQQTVTGYYPGTIRPTRYHFLNDDLGYFSGVRKIRFSTSIIHVLCYNPKIHVVRPAHGGTLVTALLLGSRSIKSLEDQNKDNKVFVDAEIMKYFESHVEYIKRIRVSSSLRIEFVIENKTFPESHRNVWATMEVIQSAIFDHQALYISSVDEHQEYCNTVERVLKMLTELVGYQRRSATPISRQFITLICKYENLLMALIDGSNLKCTIRPGNVLLQGPDAIFPEITSRFLNSEFTIYPRMKNQLITLYRALRGTIIAGSFHNPKKVSRMIGGSLLYIHQYFAYILNHAQSFCGLKRENVAINNGNGENPSVWFSHDKFQEEKLNAYNSYTLTIEETARAIMDPQTLIAQIMYNHAFYGFRKRKRTLKKYLMQYLHALQIDVFPTLFLDKLYNQYAWAIIEKGQYKATKAQKKYVRSLLLST